jgi:hypothetical protein
MVQTTKEYTDGKVMVHVTINDRQPFALAFDDEQEIRQLGDCLRSIGSGCGSVKIG